YSFVLQIDAAERAGVRFVPRMLRRVLELFALGVGHIVLLYGGDVLTTYGVVCLALLAMYRVGDRVALRTAGIIYSLVALPLIGSAAFLEPSAFMPSHTEARREAAVQTQARLGSPAEIVAHHVAGLDLLVIQAASLQGPTALAMFLLGMVAARRRMFAGHGGQLRFLRHARRIGCSVGGPGGVLYALLGGDTNTW